MQPWMIFSLCDYQAILCFSLVLLFWANSYLQLLTLCVFKGALDKYRKKNLKILSKSEEFITFC